jgi:glyoxylase-like metal-dependent hydrolase (beta-lactamase superfamily II)
MLGMHMPDIDVWSEAVAVVLGQNPGLFAGPGTNTYILGTSRCPLLLDTGQGVSGYVPLLKRALSEVRNADRLQEVLVSHDHPDHIGGADDVRRNFDVGRMRKMPYPHREGSEPFAAIKDGELIETEGATLRALYTPGHAPDHLCFYMNEEKALFTGDLVLGAGTVVIAQEGDLADYLNSLRRILDLDLAVIYPGHGPAIRNPREKVEAYLAHRALREEQILAGLRKGARGVSQLVKRIYTDVPDFLHFAAAMSVEAHLRKLESEGLVQRDGEMWCCR